MAPEIINGKDKYDEKVDVYSFGVLIFFILNGGEMPHNSIGDICRGVKAPIPNEFTQFSKDLINLCWEFEPSHRPSFDEICSIMEENNYHLINCDDMNMREALNLINHHKICLPFY